MIIHRRRPSAADPGTLPAGVTIDGYRIERLLGKGGMGAVYEATQLSLNRRVALKLVAPVLARDPTVRERFRREGPLQAAIDHPHILPVYEAGEAGDDLFIAMRLVRGRTLKQLLAAGQLDHARMFGILCAVAEALDAAHAVGLVHRDVKPQNVLVAARDHAYLADFGVSRAPGEQTLTGSGQLLGSIEYVSPEQIRGEHVTAASDLYALACVLHECLTGLVPFPRESNVAVLWAHLFDPPPRPSEIRPELPPALDAVIAKGMAKEPEHRFESARALIHGAAAGLGREPQPDLDDELSATVFPDGTLVRAAPPPARPARRRTSRARALSPSLGAALTGLLVTAAAGLGGYLVAHNSGGKSQGLRTVSAAGGHLQLTAPGDWKRAPNPARLPGASLSGAVQLSPAGALAASGLVAGTATASGPSGLPAGLAQHTGGARREAVHLGRLEAYRYSGLKLPGLAPRLTVYALPTADRVALIACLPGPGGAGPRLRTCESIAQTVRLRGLRPVPVEPSKGYAKRLTETFASLNEARLAAKRRMSGTSTQAAQASAAQGFVRAYQGAHRRIAAAKPGPAARGPNASLASALTRARNAYRRLASAARQGKTGAYDAARRAARTSEVGVRRALERLTGLGYRLRQT